MKIFLKNFFIPTLTNKQNSSSQAILIEDGKIKKIGTTDRLVPHQYDKLLDGANKKAILPGFINAHTHLAMTLFRGYADDLPLKSWLEEKIWPIEEKLTSEDVYWGALLGMQELIKSGVTGFADMYFFMDEVAKACKECGMRGLLSYGIIAQDDTKKRQEIDKAIELARNWDGQAEGRIKVALSPHAVYSTIEQVWEEVKNVAAERNLLIHTHLAETEEEVSNSYKEYNMSPVCYLNKLGIFEVPTIAAHCVHVDREDIDILADKSVNVVHNPGSNMKLGVGIAPVSEMLDCGVRVSLGTDGAASNNNLDVWEEIRLASLLQKVASKDPTTIPPTQALKMGTVHGACALGWPDAGEIKEGNKADLIIVDLDKPHLIPRYNLVSNLVYSGRAGDVETVIIDGKIVMENGDILTVDEEEVKSKVSKLQQKYA